MSDRTIPLSDLLVISARAELLSSWSLLAYFAVHFSTESFSQLACSPRYIASGRIRKVTPLLAVYLVGVFTDPLPKNGRLLIRLLHSNSFSPLFQGLCLSADLYATVSSHSVSETLCFLLQVEVRVSYSFRFLGRGTLPLCTRRPFFIFSPEEGNRISLRNILVWKKNADVNNLQNVSQKTALHHLTETGITSSLFLKNGHV
jgi:hypothetical protein